MWINVNTGGTFVLHADIRYELWKQGTELPGVLTDEVIAPHGYMPVTQVKPTYNPITHGLSAQPCISNNGVWEQHFVPYALDPAIVANNCFQLQSLTSDITAVLDGAGLLGKVRSDMKSRLIKKIDTDADAIYQAVQGSRGSEYALAEADAVAFKAAGYTGSVPASVHAWAAAKSQTDQWAADDILATATAWRSAMSAIRTNRLACKEAARSAVDVSAVAIQWSGFVVAIRGQLGL